MHLPPLRIAALALLLGALPAFAQSAADFQVLEKQIQDLQAKVNKLQKEQADSTISYSPGKETAPVVETNKILLSAGVTQLKLYGDIRLRYQYDEFERNVDAPLVGGAGPNDDQRDRFRLRLRIGADVQLGDQFFASVVLATNQASDSSNQTMTEGYDNYGIYIQKALLGWTPNDWLTVIAGKQANPFYTTSLVWDPDITPAGISEVLDLTKAFAPDESRFSLQLVSLQGAYEDNNEFNSGADAKTDAWQFVEQLRGTYHFNKTTSVTFAPGFMTYTAASLTGLMDATPFTKPSDTIAATGTSPAETPVGETRDLEIITAPGDVSFSLANIPTKFYWDFAYNAAGGTRATDEYFLSTHKTVDDFAWLVGLTLGENAHQGDWSFNLNYRRVGMDSVDPNLNDSDFALSFINIQGIQVGVAYNFTDSLVGAITYDHSWELRDSIVGGEATGGAVLANAKSTDVLQVDLNLKF
jgi:hypothetical protein